MPYHPRLIKNHLNSEHEESGEVVSFPSERMTQTRGTQVSGVLFTIQEKLEILTTCNAFSTINGAIDYKHKENKKSRTVNYIFNTIFWLLNPALFL